MKQDKVRVLVGWTVALDGDGGYYRTSYRVNNDESALSQYLSELTKEGLSFRVIPEFIWK